LTDVNTEPQNLSVEPNNTFFLWKKFWIKFFFQLCESVLSRERCS